MRGRSGTLACALAILLITGAAAWATDFKMQATTIDPGAQGTVTVELGKARENTTVKIRVEHLAKPTLLTPSASNYVVWIQQEGQPPQNGGTLRVGDDEKGEIVMTTTAAQFRVWITAETEAHPEQPSGRVVLHSNIQQ